MGREPDPDTPLPTPPPRHCWAGPFPLSPLLPRGDQLFGWSWKSGSGAGVLGRNKDFQGIGSLLRNTARYHLGARAAGSGISPADETLVVTE